MNSNNQNLKTWQNILTIGSSATFVELLTHPLEVMKVSKQLSYSILPKTNPYLVGNQFTKSQDLLSFAQQRFTPYYKGVSASILRAVVSNFIRFGTFEPILKHLEQQNSNKSQFKSKLSAAFVCSFLASIVTNPWDLIRVRMVADKTGQYSSLYKSFRSIYVEDGISELYKGSIINITRGIMISTVEMSTYFHFKQLLTTREDEGYKWNVYFLSSIFSGFVSAVASFPFDIVRTKYMHERSRGLKSQKSLKHIARLFAETYEKEGIKGFTKGFSPYLSRFLLYGPLFWNTYELFRYGFGQMNSISSSTY
jgi:solute carrier family 25 iron transporter 28/37